MAKHNTLNSRIRKVVYLSIALSVLFFFIVLSITSAEAERRKGYLLASMIGNLISTQVFSSEELAGLGVSGFNQITSDKEKLRLWAERIDELQNKTISTLLKPDKPGYSITAPLGVNTAEIPDFFMYIHHPVTKDFYRLGEIAQIRIEIRGSVLYESSNYGETRILKDIEGKIISPMFSLFAGFFEVESKNYLYMAPDAAVPATQSGLPFATVTVRLDPTFLAAYYLYMLLGALAFGLAGFFATGFLAKALSRHLSKPFTILEARLKSLAMEDYETTLHSQIVVKKRPIAEIASIADSTNTILKKMQEFHEMMMTQKNQLESQKNELENQKEELLESRQMIQEAQSQLVQSQNLAAIGQLTAAISHEINDPLDNIRESVGKQSILISKLLSHQKIEGNPELKNFITQLGEAAALNSTAFERISSIIKSLKSFSRQDLTETEETDINESIMSVVLLTSNLWKRRISIHEEYGEIPRITANPGLLNQVFMNIMVNAIHAIPDKGEITIRTWGDDSCVHASFRDTGTGIAENILPHIFDTGFTTKKCGKGSGLGLSICLSIIKKHNGKIDVRSKPGEGSEFIVSLPVK